MARAVAARIYGDDYQAIVFWRAASKMLLKEDSIEAVEIESNDVKSLDDVVVHHAAGWCDDSGRPVLTEYFQVKFHVDYRGSLSAEALIDPAFINASKVSFLQRAQSAWRKFGREGIRIVLYNTWCIDATDGLGDLVNGVDGRIQTEKWRGVTDRTKLGKIRAKWCKHLSCGEEELDAFLSSVRIVQGSTLAYARDDLKHKLKLAGLKTFANESVLDRYAAIARSFIVSGTSRISRDRLVRVCKATGVWDGGPVKRSAGRKLAIRSYKKGTSGFETWGDARLDLLDQFNGRIPKPGVDWTDDIASRAVEFVDKNLTPGTSVMIWLPAHYTIAALVGYIFDARSGVNVTLKQTGVYGWSDWMMPLPSGQCSKDSCLCKCDVEIDDQGNDLAVAISVTHEIAEDVEAYISDSGISVLALRSLSLGCCGSASVSGPESAAHLIDDIVCLIRRFRTERKCRGKIHLFYSAPSSMVFMLGQRLRGLGAIQLYEHDFESGLGTSYTPSISLPMKKGK